MLTSSDVYELLEQGESRTVEFKSTDVRADTLAVEMAAFANTVGGTILVGVEDDKTLTGNLRPDFEEWVANLARQNIVPAIQPEISTVTINAVTIGIIQVPKGLDKPYQTLDGRYRIRVGSTNRLATKEELSRLFQQAGLVHFDTAPVEGTFLADLDSVKLHDYWSTYYGITYNKLDLDEQNKLLLNADILAEGDDARVTTVGGLLLFGKIPQRRLPQAAMLFAVFNGLDLTADLVDKKEITGTLPEQIDHTTALVELFIPRPSVINGLLREEYVAIPKKVIRECLVNAACHRDYSIANQKITVYKFTNRVEITSPGSLPNTLTIEKIKYGNSAPRNHFLVKYLDNYRYIDGLGRGIPMMIKEMGERVRFEELGERFRVVLMIA